MAFTSNLRDDSATTTGTTANHSANTGAATPPAAPQPTQAGIGGSLMKYLPYAAVLAGGYWLGKRKKR